jgi:hypothetical protein
VLNPAFIEVLRTVPKIAKGGNDSKANKKGQNKAIKRELNGICLTDIANSDFGGARDTKNEPYTFEIRH